MYIVGAHVHNTESAALLAATAGKIGLDRELSAALRPWMHPMAMHDPGKVLLDLVISVAIGGDCLADIAQVRTEDQSTAVRGDGLQRMDGSKGQRGSDLLPPWCSRSLTQAVTAERRDVLMATIKGIDAPAGCTPEDIRQWEPVKGARWRSIALREIALRQADIDSLRSQVLSPKARHAELDSCQTLILQAYRIASTPSRSWAAWWRNADCDEAFRVTHEVEARLSALFSDADRQMLLTEIAFDARSVLDPKDPLLALRPDTVPADRTPEKSSTMVRRYRAAWDDRYQRASTYRNRLIFMTIVVTVFVAVLVVCGSVGLFSLQIDPITKHLVLGAAPDWSASPERLLTIVAICTFGAVGGLLAGAAPVARMGGVYNPAFLPWYSLILKIQMGALCGILGVLLVLGGFSSGIPTRYLVRRRLVGNGFRRRTANGDLPGGQQGQVADQQRAAGTDGTEVAPQG